MVPICTVFKWLGCLVFKWHSKTRPFRIRPLFVHLNTRQGRFSDRQYSNLGWNMTIVHTLFHQFSPGSRLSARCWELSNRFRIQTWHGRFEPIFERWQELWRHLRAEDIELRQQQLVVWQRPRSWRRGGCRQPTKTGRPDIRGCS